ncbi:hypothetical protein F3Y33_17430 [Rhizobium sp. BG6]|uniref:hypothetical protein n=1 Tax=Rhizobium sp. BG6 TaxID=2613771 RepID=UPI00193D2F07|nr:hypothetical protein [Rhizobium sp. BG6]QRM51451.1 hypothetical protein F3Y33_17430 [Rhizobium sp. BG6]
MTESNDNTQKQTSRRFGIDHSTRQIVMGSVRIPLPQSRAARLSVGGLLVAGGCLGFLPVLGFWMVPLGVLVLSHDLHVARRMRRRFSVWWQKRRKPAPSSVEKGSSPVERR